MNKIINLIVGLFKTIFFLITLPFLIIKLVLEYIAKGVSFLYNKFMMLFKFSLSFKITFLHTLLGLIILVIVCSSFIIALREYFIFNVDKEIKSDFSVVKMYLEKTEEFNNSELNTYLSKNNNVEIILKNIQIYSLKSKMLINRKININLYFDFNYTNKQIENITINNKEYKIIIVADFLDRLFILKVVYIFMLILSILALTTTISLSRNITIKMFKPIKEITESTKNITGKELDKRIITTESYDDLKELSDTFNEMMERIQNSYNKQKQFVSDASHELRTPISVIQGYINMLDRWGKDDKEILEESIKAIKNESKSMEKLVNSLLFLARIDKNTQNLEKEEFKVNKLIEELVKETSMIDQNHKIINQNTENIVIFADRALLKQAIRVFIQNSIKYTFDDGKIILDSYSKENEIYVTIKDTGIGISKEDLPNVFNRFFRADSSRTKETGGVGLGLSIAKWIIDSHNGKIDLRSVEGVGTKVIISLPYKGKEEI